MTTLARNPNKVHSAGEFSFNAYIPRFSDGVLQSITLERKVGYTHVTATYDLFVIEFETSEMLIQPSIMEDYESFDVEYGKMENVQITKKEKTNVKT